MRLIATLLLAVASLSASAASVRVSGASVYVNEVLILTLKAGRNEARAANVADSFRKLSPNSELTVEGDSKSYRILDGDRVVITVARLEAKAQGTTVAALASQWLSNLRRALNTAPIAVPTDTLKIPIGKPQVLEVSGSELGKTVVATTDDKVATAKLGSGKLTIVGKAFGDVVISLTAGSFVKTLSVRVLPVAASLPQSFILGVTGDPASEETVRGAVETALWARFASIPGSEASFRLPTIGEIGPEQSKTFPINVKVSGPDAFPAEGQVQVTIVNEPYAYKAEADLWYCNDPENVTRFQNLFAAELSSNQPVRFLYHHYDAMPASMIVSAQIVNDSAKTARVLLIPGDKRDRNPVLAGLLAGDQLLRNWVRYSGEIVSIPPRTSLPFAMRRLSPQETISGLAYLRLLTGGPEKVLVRVDSIPNDVFDAKTEAALQTSAPWRRLPPQPLSTMERAKPKLSAHVYPTPFKTEEVDYTVGGRYGFVRIGQKPIPRPDGKGLDGNFGVFYTVDGKIDNPLSDPVDVEVVFEASAGYSGALFILNGEVRRTPLLQPKEEAQIAKYRLLPGEKKEFTFMTVPLSGSSYPATIVVRPVGAGIKLKTLIDN